MTNKLPSNYQWISKYLPVNYQVISCFSCKLRYEWRFFLGFFFFVKFRGFLKNYTGSPDQKRSEYCGFGWNIEFFLLFLRLAYVKIHCTPLAGGEVSSLDNILITRKNENVLRTLSSAIHLVFGYSLNVPPSSSLNRGKLWEKYWHWNTEMPYWWT